MNNKPLATNQKQCLSAIGLPKAETMNYELITNEQIIYPLDIYIKRAGRLGTSEQCQTA